LIPKVSITSAVDPVVGGSLGIFIPTLLRPLSLPMKKRI